MACSGGNLQYCTQDVAGKYEFNSYTPLRPVFPEGHHPTIASDHHSTTERLSTPSTPKEPPPTQHKPLEPAEKAKATVKEFGINLEKPKHAQFSVQSVRVKTFEKGWPAELRQTPQQLAEAGFFYGGTGDTVFCFFCGQGLNSWEEQDDPWEEHAKWASHCVFLKNVKGPEYVEAVSQKDRNPQKYLAWKRKNDEKERKKRSRTERDGRSKFSEELLVNPAAASVLSVFGQEKTINAIKIFIKQTGKTEFTSADLTNIVFDVEDGKLSSIDCTDGAPSSSHNEDEEISNLMEENLNLKKQTSCVICRNELVSVVFLPCGHICCCADCSPAMKDCPLCHAFIKGTVRTFLT